MATPVALALSGGSDSLALLHLAAPWCARAGRPLLALTVDHGLSPDAAGWTAFAGACAQAAGASWRALAWAGPKPSTATPEAARAARHALLADAAREAGARVLLFGHTADDVAEGERMRATDTPGLGRLRAWAPSPAWPQGRGVFLLRPLLGLSRAELRDWLQTQGVGRWVEDPANGDLRYARARARAALGGTARPPPPADDVSPDLSALAALAETDAWGRVVWPRAVLLNASPRTRARAVAAAATCVGGGAGAPRSAAAEAAGAAIAGAPGVRTLAGARIAVTTGEVLLTRTSPRDPPASPSLEPVWDGRFEMTFDAPGLQVARLGGRAAGLPPADRRALSAAFAAARPHLPVLLGPGPPRLPRPFGDGPGVARCLVGERLRAACGAVRCEADLA